MADWEGVPGINVTATGVLGQEARSTSDKLTGYAVAQATGTWSSLTVQCQGSNDGGTTWVALQVVNMATGATDTGFSAVGIYRADVGGVHRYRWYCSAFSSATGAKIHTTLRIG